MSSIPRRMLPARRGLRRDRRRSLRRALGAVPRIGLNHNRSGRPLDPDTLAARSVTRLQRVGADLVHVVPSRLARSDGGHKLVEGIDVGDGLLSVLADSEHDCLKECPGRPFWNEKRPGWRGCHSRGVRQIPIAHRRADPAGHLAVRLVPWFGRYPVSLSGMAIASGWLARDRI